MPASPAMLPKKASSRSVIKRQSSTVGTCESFDDLGTFGQVTTLQVVKELKQLKIMCVSVPEAGHLVPTANVAVALAQRKHKVQLVTCAWAGPKMEGMCKKTGCEFVGVAPEVRAAESGEGLAAELKDKDMMSSMFMYYSNMMHKPIQELVKQGKPDVIVGDFITLCCFDIADEFKIPVVVNIPGPVAFANLFTPLSFPIAMLKIYLTKPRAEAEAMTRIRAKLFEMLYARPVLLHGFFGLEAPIKLLPNIFVTGSPAPRLAGGVKETSMPELNSWLDWVRREGLRVVYVTMGSMQILDEFQVQGLFNGLLSLQDCAVLWSLKEDQQAFLPGGGTDSLPKRFFINKWLPQGEALQLPEVALVITHCGWGGLNETINAGKPIVATPFRADQPLNAQVAKKRGLAVVLNTSNLTAASVAQGVAKVLNDPSYKKCATELQAVLLRTGGAEKCAETVEQLANGYEELVSQPPTVGSALREKTPTLLLIGILGTTAALLLHRAFVTYSGRVAAAFKR